jgi:transcription antitermination factor NusG
MRQIQTMRCDYINPTTLLITPAELDHLMINSFQMFTAASSNTKQLYAGLEVKLIRGPFKGFKVT